MYELLLIEQKRIGVVMHIQIDKEHCCGCTACEYVCPLSAISMVEDEKGFLYPQVDESKCVNCGKCLNICGYHKDKGKLKSIAVYAFQRESKKKRLESQSGGAFSATAEAFLKSVGKVSVYGVINELNDIHYARATSLQSLKQQYGSKYVQAKLDNTFDLVRKDLKEGYRVLFSGTACYVDGLYSYLERANVDQTGLYTCDIICHGVASPKLFRQYLDELEKTYGGKVINLNFRNKYAGWCNYGFTFEIDKTKKRVFKNVFISGDWNKIFYSSSSVRPSCFLCAYASQHRVADITIFDYWGIDKVCPELNDNTGTSGYMVNSLKGQELFSLAESTGIVYKETSFEDCLQPNMQHPTEKPENYEDFWKCYEEKGFVSSVRQYCGYSPETNGELIENKRYIRRAVIWLKKFLLSRK